MPRPPKTTPKQMEVISSSSPQSVSSRSRKGFEFGNLSELPSSRSTLSYSSSSTTQGTTEQKSFSDHITFFDKYNGFFSAAVVLFYTFLALFSHRRIEVCIILKLFILSIRFVQLLALFHPSLKHLEGSNSLISIATVSLILRFTDPFSTQIRHILLILQSVLQLTNVAIHFYTLDVIRRAKPNQMYTDNTASRGLYTLSIWSIFFVWSLWSDDYIPTVIADMCITFSAFPFCPAPHVGSTMRLSSTLTLLTASPLSVFLVSYLRRAHPAVAMVLYDTVSFPNTSPDVSGDTLVYDQLSLIYNTWSASSLAPFFPQDTADASRHLQSFAQSRIEAPRVFRALRTSVLLHIQAGALDDDFLASKEGTALMRHGELRCIFRASVAEMLARCGHWIWAYAQKTLKKVKRKIRRHRRRKRRQKKKLASSSLANGGAVTYSSDSLHSSRSSSSATSSSSSSSSSAIPRSPHLRGSSLLGDAHACLQTSHVGPTSSLAGVAQRGNGNSPGHVGGARGIQIDDDLHDRALNHSSSVRSLASTSQDSDEATTPETLATRNENYLQSYLDLFYNTSAMRVCSELEGAASASKIIRRRLRPISVVAATPFPSCQRLSALRVLLSGNEPPAILSYDAALYVRSFVEDMATPSKCIQLDAFKLNRACGWPLVVAMDGACQALRLYGEGFDRQSILHWAGIIEQLYHPNPYHSNIHAADVLTTLTALLKDYADSHPENRGRLRALVISAAGHDSGHPGLSNRLVVKGGHPIGLAFPESALEVYHGHVVLIMLTRAIRDLQTTDFVLNRGEVAEFIRLTDPKHMVWLVDQLQCEHQQAGLHVELASVLMLCDICNQMKPFGMAKHWAYSCCSEFQQAAKLEEALELSSLVRSDAVLSEAIPPAQCAFLKSAVLPMAQTMLDYNADAGTAPWSQQVLQQLVNTGQRNHELWSAVDPSWSDLFSTPLHPLDSRPSDEWQQAASHDTSQGGMEVPPLDIDSSSARIPDIDIDVDVDVEDSCSISAEDSPLATSRHQVPRLDI
eukprot:gnl/Dysnectes_brevis/3613_a4598_588.p1 GENE.gnl/Dysnectes_brevis/3613_a4598_588~~gnl/Dysnectes_brevis/3613_a4598_588.p1  ORF type:complete len:1025 (+),score=248.72 gnl/Dysnectes_brevis/3613_a4598_588:86-3160(+)